MSLRTKLLLLSLLTLILPWAGWQYAQQMETTLRRGQEEALLTTAQVLSRVVASEPELLYRVPDLRRDFDPARGDLFAPLLGTRPLLDGFADEWPQPARPVPGFDAATGGATWHEPKVRLGVHGRSMHLYVEVAKPSRAIRSPGARRQRAARAAPIASSCSRTTSSVTNAHGPSARSRRDRCSCAPATSARRGNLRATKCRTSKASGARPASGYAIELRAPLNLFGTQLADSSARCRRRDRRADRRPRVDHTGSEALKQRLEQYAPDGVRVSVVDTHGWLLARAGSIALRRPRQYPGMQRDDDGFTRSIYRVLLLERRSARPALRSSVRNVGRAGRCGARRQAQRDLVREVRRRAFARACRCARFHTAARILGALVVEQPGEQLVQVREIALTRLLNLTVVATLFVIVVTIVFAARLSLRIRRLSRAASTALTAEGRIEPHIPDTSARDELGALARSYDTLLGRLQEYTNYLQTLGTKLSHELRTPLTIVSSSLENLSSEEHAAAGRAELHRARPQRHEPHACDSHGAQRGDARRADHRAHRARALRPARAGQDMGQAYRQTFVGHAIETQLPDGALLGRRLAGPDRPAARQAHGQRDRLHPEPAARSRSSWSAMRARAR